MRLEKIRTDRFQQRWGDINTKKNLGFIHCQWQFHLPFSQRHTGQLYECPHTGRGDQYQFFIIKSSLVVTLHLKTEGKSSVLHFLEWKPRCLINELFKTIFSSQILSDNSRPGVETQGHYSRPGIFSSVIRIFLRYLSGPASIQGDTVIGM